MNALDFLPMYFRDKWPMKRFYWQAEDMELAAVKAQELSAIFETPQAQEE